MSSLGEPMSPKAYRPISRLSKQCRTMCMQFRWTSCARSSGMPQPEVALLVA